MTAEELQSEIGYQRAVNSNLQTRIGELLRESDSLRGDLKLMATVDPEIYKAALSEIALLKERIESAQDALKGNYY